MANKINYKMRQLFSAAVTLLILVIIVGVSPKPPEGKYKVELSLPEWNAVIQSLPYSQSITANDATALQQKIVLQVQAQLPDSLKNKKP